MEQARSLRRAMTPPEVRLWVRLRTLRDQGFRFRRQHPVGPYVLDFYCPELKLAIEVDGLVHDLGNRPERDVVRDEQLLALGIRTVRIPAAELLRDADQVGQSLYELISSTPPQSASPTAPP